LGKSVSCDVAAHAGLRVPVESLPELRRQPGPVVGEPLPPAFLKHADEQTVAGLAAVFRAIHDHHLGNGQALHGYYRDWGVLAAPRFLGRPALAAALQRFQAEGAWGVSPHLIPHRSLHSISGTVSQALKVHGPNFGVGGGPGSELEALLAALALLERQRLPGVWVVLTRLDPEAPPDPNGRPAPGTACVALALALVPPRPDGHGIRLRLVAGAGEGSGRRNGATGAGLDLFRMHSLLDTLQAAGRGETAHVLDAGCRLELYRQAAGTRNGVSRQGLRPVAPPCAEHGRPGADR
jgi:hypothetical protein